MRPTYISMTSMTVRAFCFVCLAALLLGVGVADVLTSHAAAGRPSRIALRQMEIAQSHRAESPLPVRALIAPEIHAKDLAANLDEAERADAGPLSELQALPSSRRALARRIANLE